MAVLPRSVLASLLCIGLMACSRSALLDLTATPAPGGGGGGEGGAPPVSALDITGTWYACGSTLTFENDGTWRSVAREGGCVREGHWTLDGDVLDRWTDAVSCGGSLPEPLLGVSVGRPPGGLILYEEASTNGKRVYLDGTAPRTVWTIEGEQDDNPGAHSTVAVIVGEPSQGLASACYWSAAGQCSSLFSCSGYITYWDLTPEKLIGQTSCIGDCPCGSVITGEVLPDGSVDAIFYGETCNGNHAGHFIGVPQVEN